MQQTFRTLRRVALAAAVMLGSAACDSDPFEVTSPDEPLFAKGGPNAPPTNGGRIFFASFVTGNYDIYSVNHDGTDLRRLTFGLEHETQPSVSPDGKKVAYLKQTIGGHEIWIMDADGGKQKMRLPRQEYIGNLYPLSWSPDGRQLALSYQEAGTLRFRMATMSVNSGAPQVLPMEGRHPTWSPDGSYLAYVGIVDGQGYQLVTSRLDGSDYQQRTQDATSCCGYPQWSPDGSRILYSTYENGTRRIRIAGVGVGNNVLNLSDEPEASGFWSPDGTRVVYVPLMGTGLRVVYATGGEATPIIQGVNAIGWMSWGR